jgi:beta-glucanase (GH16 family)
MARAKRRREVRAPARRKAFAARRARALHATPCMRRIDSRKGRVVGCLVYAMVAAACSSTEDSPWQMAIPAEAGPPSAHDDGGIEAAASRDAGVVAEAAPDRSAPPPPVPDSGPPAPEPDAAPVAEGGDEPPAGWTLTWSDEFDGPDGSGVDSSKWVHDVGGGGWGNKEREYYTDGTANAVIQGGDLVITAGPDGASQESCWYGQCQYTSARLNSSNGFSQQYGRFEARIQIPLGQGLWPAFWLLGNNIGNVGWPACGEIDIMENIGKQPGTAYGSLHAQGYNATAGYTLMGQAKLGDAFHRYAIEWEPTAIRFYVDDQLYETHAPSDATGGGGKWAFDQPFFIILNVAVGGNWPGDPDSTTTFPQTMKVDWVRVYSKS